MNTIEDNKVIAKFMKLPVNNDITQAFLDKQRNYHESEDLLMEVVLEIEIIQNRRFKFNTTFAPTKIHDKQELKAFTKIHDKQELKAFTEIWDKQKFEVLIETTGDNETNANYKAVVKFANWHNKQEEPFVSKTNGAKTNGA